LLAHQTTEHSIKEMKGRLAAAEAVKASVAEKTEAYGALRERRGLEREHVMTPQEAEAAKYDLYYYTKMWEDRLEVNHRKAHLLLEAGSAEAAAAEREEAEAAQKHAKEVARLHGEE
jgi:hypothetical protein